MKITVYTISDCPFSQQEKEYLKANNLPFEEKNLEQNREWLTEMLTISNNFAGTPVTKIEDDKGEIHILKGFTKEEFDQVLGLTPAKTEPATSSLNAQIPVPPSPKPSSSTSSLPQTPSSPMAPPSPSPVSSQTISQPSPVFNQSTPPPSTSSSFSSPQVDPALQSILENLKQKQQQPVVNQPMTNQPSTDQSSSPPTNLPNIPDFPKK